MTKNTPKRRTIRPAQKPANTKRSAPKRVRQGSERINASGQSKLDLIASALQKPKGASIADLVKVTGWQQHSVRGALAGALKKRGLSITSTKTDGERRYRIEATR